MGGVGLGGVPVGVVGGAAPAAIARARPWRSDGGASALITPLPPDAMLNAFGTPLRSLSPPGPEGPLPLVGETSRPRLRPLPICTPWRAQAQSPLTSAAAGTVVTGRA